MFEYQGRQMRVAIVEDGAMLANAMAAGLETARFSPQICCDGDEA